VIYIAATVQIEQITGTAGSETYTYKDTTSGTRYYTTDSAVVGATTNPIPIPTTDAGKSGSYWVTHCINVTAAPTAYIKNLRYYQTWTTSPYDDWTLGTGGDLLIGVSSATVADAKVFTQGFVSGSYDQADGVQGTYGYHISGKGAENHSYYSGCSAPMSGGASTITDFSDVDNAYMVQSGQVVAVGTGRSYCIVTQVIVASGATQGDKTDKNATFVFSEV